MTRIALAVPPEIASRLARELARHGDEVVAVHRSADALIEALSAGDIECAVVDSHPQFLTARLMSAADSAGIRLAGLVSDQAGRRNARAVGLVELADAASPWPEVQALLRRSPTPAHAPPPPHESRGTVIGVWGPHGAPGRTSLAITIAAELAAAGHSVVLADADTHSASVAPALGLLDESPGFAAACRLAAMNALTTDELDRVAEHYTSTRGGFRVLTGIGRADRWPELSAPRVRSVIAVCRQWVDFTVLDTAGSGLETAEHDDRDPLAPRRNAATRAVLGDADQIVAVGSADPIGLSRFLRAHVELVDRLEGVRPIALMNRVRSSAIGLDPVTQVRHTLMRFGGIPSPVLIPDDRPAFDAALLAGRTVSDVAPRSPARVAVAGLVRQHLAPEASPRGRVRRRP